MSGFLVFFWLVILTSSKVHLHYKCAILTRPSSPTHLFIRIILKSSRKLVDIWNSTYGIITNHSDIKIAIENDKVKIDPVSVEEMSCGQ